MEPWLLNFLEDCCERHGCHDAWGLWCLGHNLEIAAALSAVRNLSWSRGWDAHKLLTEFAGDANDAESYTEA